LKQANPGLILGVAGCLAQQEQNILMDRIPFLDFIVGPDAVESIQQIVHRVELGEGPIVWTEFDSEKNYSIPEQPLIKDSREKPERFMQKSDSWWIRALKRLFCSARTSTRMASAAWNNR
jgi:tRNA A37 methylthiotransferase MiaB